MLHDRLAAQGAGLIVEALARLDQLVPHPQPESGVTYAHKISKEEAQLSWALPAAELARKVRAFNPFPGVGLSLAGQPVKVWQAEAVPGAGAPGQVLAVTGSSSKIEFLPLPGDDPKVRQPDITVARTVLGWEPKVPLREGLEKSLPYFQGEVAG